MHMQRSLLIAVLLASSMIASAQEKNLSFAPLGLINKVRLKYEAQSKNNLKQSAGSYFTLHYPLVGLHTGVMIDPYMRFYGKEDLTGPYFQPKIAFGYYWWASDDCEDCGFATIGGGLAGGIQLALGEKKRTLLDMNIGIRYMHTIGVDGPHGLIWYWLGPGSILNPHLGLAFKL